MIGAEFLQQLEVNDPRNIVNLVVVFLAAFFVVLFFLRRKAYKLMVYALASYVAFVGLILLSGNFYTFISSYIAIIAAIIISVCFLFAYDRNIKSWFYNLGRKNSAGGEAQDDNTEVLKATVGFIIRACQNLSKTRTGALIVIAPTVIPDAIIETGVTLDAIVSAELLEALFIDGAPMHDGAVIIRRSTLVAAGCFLPLSQNPNISKALGTRHRAGIGITEETDMVTIIVSEETGIISFVERGEIKRYVTSERLKDILYNVFKIETATTAKKK